MLGEPKKDAERNKLGEPKKEKGKKEENISMRQFWRYRMYYRKEFTGGDKDLRFHWLWSMRKLAELFVIIVENR